MFETLTLTTILLTLFFFYQNQRLGLTSAVPKDPNDRARFFCNECLTTLKNLLALSQVDSLDTHRLRFRKPGASDSSELRLEQGKVILEQPGQAPKTLHNLGAQGELRFEKLSEQALMATIEARLEDNASHKTAVRLQVSYAAAP